MDLLDDASLPKLRADYEREVRELSMTAQNMREAGFSSEEIARKVGEMRRELGVKYKNLTPPEQLDMIYERSLAKYGDKLGPTVDWLRAKGKTWEEIIESATRPGGKDIVPRLINKK